MPQVPTVLIELNEINFDLVRSYLSESSVLFPGFRRLVEGKFVLTSSEDLYEELEPWIQWPSVHTGLPFKEHKVFRLGDIISSDAPQIFEKAESMGLKVGAISPMNADNRLNSPTYFIPDPWTSTHSDESFFSRLLTGVLRQTVNDNAASKITVKSIFALVLALFKFVRPSRYSEFVRLFLMCLKQPWRKALFLDLFLHEVHLSQLKSCKPNFSTLFLNAGAHIQHHYFLNSKFAPFKEDRMGNPDWYMPQALDPICEMLKVYDAIISEYLNLDCDVVIATGLRQVAYEEPQFYYRLKDHRSFLEHIGINFKDVFPRMTRDFLITFESDNDVTEAFMVLDNLRLSDGEKLFGEISLRNKELFVVLTYPKEVTLDLSFSIQSDQLKLIDHVSFVAIKNGQHDSTGYAYFSDAIAGYAPDNNAHVCEIHDSLLAMLSSKSSQDRAFTSSTSVASD